MLLDDYRAVFGYVSLDSHGFLKNDCECFVYMCVCASYMCLQTSREEGFPGTMLKLSLGPWQNQQVLSTAELSLQPLKLIFKKFIYFSMYECFPAYIYICITYILGA